MLRRVPACYRFGASGLLAGSHLQDLGQKVKVMSLNDALKHWTCLESLLQVERLMTSNVRQDPRYQGIYQRS